MQIPFEVYSHGKQIIHINWTSWVNSELQISSYVLERSDDLGETWKKLTTSIYKKTIYDDLSLDLSKVYQYRLKGIYLDLTETDYSYSNFIRPTDLRRGYAFDNPDTNSNHYYKEWGLIVTPDELRYVGCFGNPLIAPNGETIIDEMLQWYIDQAIYILERELNFNLIPKSFRASPARDPQTGETIPRTDIPVGEEYTEEDPYDYKREMTAKYMYLKLRHRPIMEVQQCWLRDVFGNPVIDLRTWVKINHRVGSVEFYPHGNALIDLPLGNYNVASGFLPFVYSRDYPDAIYIDYTVGYNHSSKVDKELRRIIFLLATCMLLNDYGDGKSPGLASASISLSGISESYATTQSASIDYKEKIEVIFCNGDSKKIKIGKAYKLWKKGKLLNIKTVSINPNNILDIQNKVVYDITEHDTKNKKCYKIKTKEGKFGITEDHSIFIIQDNKLIEIKGKDIKINDNIAIIKNGKVLNSKVLKIKQYKQQKMYDLSIMDFENFVCNTYFIVHNTNALFGARILAFERELKTWYTKNAQKYQGVQIGVLG